MYIEARWWKNKIKRKCKKMNSNSEASKKYFWGRFTNKMKIGQGGFAVVYKAYDNVEKRHVALKVFPPSKAASFFTEQALLKRLKNVPHIVNMYSSWAILPVKEAKRKEKRTYKNSDGRFKVFPDEYVIVMELLRGKRLSDKQTLDLISRDHKHLRTVAREGLTALNEIHKRGVVHGDVKLDNITYEAETGIIMIDFGVSCVTLDVEESRRLGLLKVQCRPSTAWIGTYTSFSPDRWLVILMEHDFKRRGKRFEKMEWLNLEKYFKMMRKDDIFAFGTVLYELMTRQRFPGIKPVPNPGLIQSTLKTPGIMVPSKFTNNYGKEKLYPLISALLTSSYKNRPTASAALELLTSGKKWQVSKKSDGSKSEAERRELAKALTGRGGGASRSRSRRTGSGMTLTNSPVTIEDTLSTLTNSPVTLENYPTASSWSFKSSSSK